MASDSGNNMDREIILADFQACTGIDNIAEAIALLELNNWDLVAAINGVIPQENGILPSEASGASRLGADSHQPAAAPLASTSSSSSPLHSSSSSTSTSAVCPPAESPRPSRMLSFRVEYRQRSVEVVLEESGTVGEIKQILQTELQVPVSKMQLKGWKTGGVSDTTVLSSLHLPKHNSLYILTPDIAPTASSSQSSGLQESQHDSFLLIVSHHEAQRDYSLNFPGGRTIQEVKRNVSDLTNIPVRHQQWEGWPASAPNDSVTLAASGISHPCHHLSVSRRPASADSQEAPEESTDVHMQSDSEVEDFEDVCEFGDEGDMFVTQPSGSSKRPLIPDRAENEGDALLHFTAEFTSRYGEEHPVFFVGSLEAAFQEAFYGRARDRKLLSIYLHHDSSVLANVFCSQTLCADTVVSCLGQNFVTWAWDVTKEANRARLLTMCTRLFGSGLAQTLRSFEADRFPLLLVAMGKRASSEVLHIIQGNSTVDEQQEDSRDEDEREARELVKREQDEAYRLSLEADRKKREALEKEEAALSLQEQMRKEQEEEREAIRLSLEQTLPTEPKEDSKEPVSKLRVRTPSGEFLERRFLGSCRLQVLFHFMASKGFPLEQYKLLTTFPRRNITQLDPLCTFLEAKLFPQETLFLEAKD
ncbi:hypothetical protein AAFF_G00330520 [Aldrovandia affinis]|uniref:UBX domain-containing protein n=1 Tax=Aldrovandia affinis TaxID=143900 RepID=A0AAD7R6V2_9TELE|nr:hypothetical protein AAFF_G00330520 [Aldrovandia affinis]